MENLTDCFILLLVIFLTKFMHPFTGRQAQMGILEWNYFPGGGNISPLSLNVNVQVPIFFWVQERGGGGGGRG